MSLNIFWFLPTHGDGQYLGTAEGARSTTVTCSRSPRPPTAWALAGC
jgi:hypothetical protein